jgi:hypothetical protein
VMLEPLLIVAMAVTAVTHSQQVLHFISVILAGTTDA